MDFSEIAQKMNQRLENGEDITVDLDLDVAFSWGA